MAFQAVLTVIHILSAIVWLGYVPAELVLRRSVRENLGSSCQKDFVSVYLKIVNIAGIIGMTGLLISGILLVSVIPYYGFFSFHANHWLATKQVIMIILIILVFTMIIPKAKKVRISSEKGNLDESLLKSLQSSITIVNVLVLINVLLALSRRYF